jgi:RNA polymerase subunit RPABC4/transcription elongation factor Spt4
MWFFLFPKKSDFLKLLEKSGFSLLNFSQKIIKLLQMSDITTCSKCNEEVTADSDFCPHCGTLFITVKNVFCDEHPTKSALGVCIICQKLVCDKCGDKVHGRIFCVLHRKVKVEQDWAEVFRSTDISDAELVKSVLESAGQKVSVQNFNSMGFIWDGGGDSPISRSNINKPAKVFVPIPEYLDAIKVVEEWRSSNPDVGLDETVSEQ